MGGATDSWAEVVTILTHYHDSGKQKNIIHTRRKNVRQPGKNSRCLLERNSSRKVPLSSFTPVRQVAGYVWLPPEMKAKSQSGDGVPRCIIIRKDAEGCLSQTANRRTALHRAHEAQDGAWTSGQSCPVET
jgi:hypothetical protein